METRSLAAEENRPRVDRKNPWSPPVVIERLDVPSGSIHVAREDLLTGGTKQRAIIPYLQTLSRTGVREVIYASPFCGFAQVALAVSGRALGIPITLFCERDLTSPGSLRAHEFSEIARAHGARIFLCETLAEAELRSIEFTGGSPHLFKVPLGFRDPRYIEFMSRCLTSEYVRIRGLLGHDPKRLWLPIGSGTLAGIFSKIVPRTTEIVGVDVGVLEATDPRIRNLENQPNLRIHRAPELFRERSRNLPPIPSNLHYDAKLWGWIRELGRDGDLWWNVAR